MRTDGESLCAITINKWCELGFDQGFFPQMPHEACLFATVGAAIPGVIGKAWIATTAQLGLPFGLVIQPSCHNATFHAAGDAEFGRFLRDYNVLSLPKGLR